MSYTKVLPYARGGTTGTTQTTGFNALDPQTTKGDVITHNGTDSVRLGVGSNGQVLTANSGATNGIEWAAPAVPSPTVIEIDDGDSPYTAAAAHVIIADPTAGAITINLPALSGITGQCYEIKTLSAANSVTIDGNASEPIDGATTLVLALQYEAVKLYAGATSWHIF